MQTFRSMIDARIRQGKLRRARLAALVAEHGSIAAAAREMGISRQRASQMWQQVLQEMGE